MGWAAVASTVLTGCGGGGGDSEPQVPPPVVTEITNTALTYGNEATFTARGTGLGSRVSFTATGCDGLTVLTAGATDTTMSFTCRPNQLLSVRAAALFGTTELRVSTVAVPKPQVQLTTSMGTLVVELEPGPVKATVDNFLAYVASGYYNGTIFHRIVRDFVVQGGGFSAAPSTGLVPKQGLRPPIELEVGKGLSNTRGTIAMARTTVLNSATSQFFINTVNNTTLDTVSGGYAVFGTVVSGMNIVDQMNTVATRTLVSDGNVPVTDVVLQTATRLR